jgi:uncharacterized membrane protein SpoIIM required for sporulation
LSDTQQALRRWLEGRTERWQWMERQCYLQRGARQDDAGPSRAFIEGFRALGTDLSLARAQFPDSRLARYLTDLFARSHEQLNRRPSAVWRSLGDIFLQAAPAVINDMRGALAATVALFALSLLAGWCLVSRYPELAALFASQALLDTVESGELWTTDLLNILPSSVLAFSIIANNVTVTLFAFVLGAFYGIGTLYIISLNGLMLGGVFAFTAQHGLAGRLFEFIVAHGVVELSVICLAGAAGVSLGEALVRPGNRTRAEAFRAAVRRAGVLLVAAIPFLAGAGLIEGYISPDAAFPLPARLVIGLAYGLVFWLVLTRNLWRRRVESTSARRMHPSSAQIRP